MAYRGTYRRGYARGSRDVAPGPVGRVNRRPGPCRVCGLEVPAGAGHLYRETSGGWSVTHVPVQWAGSPVSGYYWGGCPDATDRMNAGLPQGPGRRVRPEAERIAYVAKVYAATDPAQWQ